MITIQHGDSISAWGGSILISREFYDSTTGNYLLIEAHEIRTSEVGEDGDFLVAFWIPEGNNGGQGCDGHLHHVVKSIQEYMPDAGLIEMKIPEEAFD